MPDIEKVRAFLRGLQTKMLSEQMSYDDRVKTYNYSAVTLTLLTNMEKEIKRLTPKQRTLDDAVAVLNEHEYEESDDWLVDGSGDDSVVEGPDWVFPEHAVFAIAEKLEREKEAGCE